MALHGLAQHLISSVERVRAQVERAAPVGTRPHAVAHSFGTYLLGEVLHRYPYVHLGSVILHGSALPVDFNWRKIVLKRRQVERVWNEVGSRDLPLRLLRRLRHAQKFFGDAGRSGFTDARGLVHTIGPDENSCGTCRYPALRRQAKGALVHNVHVDYDHGDAHDTAGHAAYLWVPVLLNLDPTDYREFLELCTAIWRFEVADQSVLAQPFRRALESREWGWTDGLTLTQHLTNLVTAWPGITVSPARIPDIVAVARISTAQIVSTANLRRKDGITYVDDVAAEAVDPRVAAVLAVRKVLRELGEIR